MRYLAAPRPLGDATELRYIREQATFYNALPDKPVGLTLVPACFRCGSDSLRDDRVNLALICRVCGSVNAADVIRTGRLAEL